MKIIVRRPSDEELEELVLGKGGRYFDESRVLWKEGEDLPEELVSELKECQSRDRQKISKEESDRKNMMFLKNTDWMVVRKMETGKDMPEAISILRAKARLELDYSRE